MIAILSDIHANLPALEAVLADLPRVSALWVLGDLVGELPFPCQTLDRLAEFGATTPITFVAGNRELSMLQAKDGTSDDWRAGAQFRLLAWTLDQLQPHHWHAMRRWSIATVLDSVPGGACLFHGGPHYVRTLIHTPHQAEQATQGFPQRWFAGGHTHHHAYFPLGNSAYINAGSVGLPLSGTGGIGEYVLLDEFCDPRSPKCATFHTVAYDVEAVVRAMRRSGLVDLAPGVTRASTLEMQTGVHHMIDLVLFCKAYAERAMGFPIETVPPALWHEAELLWIAKQDAK